MNDNKIQEHKFLLGKEPFIRKADSKKYGTDVMMRDLLIALLPLIIFAWVKNGLVPFINKDTTSVYQMLYPLLFVFMGGFSCWFFEFIAYKFFIKEKDVFKKLRHSFAIIPGIILAMICSLNTPLWVLILGCFFATIVGKVIFGGFGNNIFNPALVGYLFISVAYATVIKSNGGYANPSEIEIMAGVTPMTNFSSAPYASIDYLVGSYGSLSDFIFGTTPGSLGETCGLLCIVSCIYLLVRKVINWRIPVIYVVTVFLLTYIGGIFNGYGFSLQYPLFHVFSGGLLFGATFMATEPVTSPRTPNGKVIFALFLGVLTVLFRMRGNLPEGVATAIITMNLFTIIIDRSSAKLRVEDKMRKVVMTYGVIALLLVAIGIYSITYTPTITVDQANTSKDKIVYTIYVDQEAVVVNTNSENEILSINNKHYDNSKYEEKFSDAILEYDYKVEKKFVIESFKQNFDDLSFTFTLNYFPEQFNVTVDKDFTSYQLSSPTYQDKLEEIKTLINANHYPYIKYVTHDNNKTNLEIIGKRPWGVEITFTVVYENGKMISFSSDSKEKETYTMTDIYPNWSGIHPEDVLPEQIIDKQEHLDDVTIVATATDTSKMFINVATLANEYIAGVQDE